jgi:chromosome segregation ATPase
VTAKYLERLNNTLNDLKYTGQSLSQSLKTLTIENEQLKREVQLYIQKASTAQQQLQQAEEINSKFEKDIKNTNIQVMQDAALLASLFEKEQIIKIDHVPAQDSVVEK